MPDQCAAHENVPGQRTDWHECQWLQYLHSVGLLLAAFRPDAQKCAMRAILRHRGELVQVAVGTFEARVDPAQKPLPPDRKRNRNARKKRRKQEKDGCCATEFDLRTEAYKLFGVDATQIPGLEASILTP